MSTYSPQTLGWWMDERRGELALTWQQVADTAGVSTETLYRADDRAMRTTTKHGIERALRWQRGSVDAIKRGEKPTPLPQEESEPSQGPAEPEPADYADEHEYMSAVYWYLRRGYGMSHEAVQRGFDMAAAIFERKNKAERDDPNSSGNQVG
jgi:hypothetical protein